jgi:hypothetical protein
LTIRYQKYGFGILDLRSGIQKKPVPNPGSRVKKAPDPGSATLKKCVKRYILLDTEAEVCNGAGEIPLDEDVPGL